jgi:hypothetical protein
MPGSIMTQPVFISYARDASRGHAEALHRALGGRTAFLDTKDIEPGERFPPPPRRIGSVPFDYAGAQELQERAMERMRRVFGDEHPSTRSAMSHLAITRRHQADQGNTQG